MTKTAVQKINTNKIREIASAEKISIDDELLNTN